MYYFSKAYLDIFYIWVYNIKETQNKIKGLKSMNINVENNSNMGWNFDNTYIKLPQMLYSKQKPIPVKSPKLIILNDDLVDSLGLDTNTLKSDKAVSVFGGSTIPKEASPIAQAYAGHQFGHFTMLGDGRAVLLGEHICPEGKRFDIQLKGSGRTKYSRGGDGRAALGPMLREYIISEAMHGLGIPTTRSLAVVTTGEDIIREGPLTGAILTRVASSHIRVGTFQYAAVYGSKNEVQALADYAINRHYLNLRSDEDKYLLFLKEVVKKQAKLIASWQLVGFIHGVMNTDNMTISGETIDYGPCAFMDTYDPSTVFSSIDTGGRYSYGNQPKIGTWNLARLAETLLPLIHDESETAVDLATNEVSKFDDYYNRYWLDGYLKKLGIFSKNDEDKDLVLDLLEIMEKNKADYTNTFRGLTLGELDCLDLSMTNEFKQWNENWKNRLKNQNGSKDDIKQLMQENNPAIIPRNHRVEESLSAANQGDYSVMEDLLEVLKDPFAYSENQVEYSEVGPPSTLPYRTFCGT